MKIQIHESQPTEAAPEWPKVMRNEITGSIIIFNGPDGPSIKIRHDRFVISNLNYDNAFLKPLTGPVTITITP